MTFADVGAFDGKYVLPLAYEVLPYGKAYATDVVEGGSDSEGSLKWRGLGYGTATIKQRVDEHNACVSETCTTYSKYTHRPKLNITTVLATADDAGLPEGCCDAIMLRTSYHHLEKPRVAIRQFERALKPGGRLLIIDNFPGDGPDAEGVPEDRAGMGIDANIILQEIGRELGWVPSVTLLEWGTHTRFGADYAKYLKPVPGGRRFPTAILRLTRALATSARGTNSCARVSLPQQRCAHVGSYS